MRERALNLSEGFRVLGSDYIITKLFAKVAKIAPRDAALLLLLLLLPLLFDVLPLEVGPSPSTVRMPRSGFAAVPRREPSSISVPICRNNRSVVVVVVVWMDFFSVCEYVRVLKAAGFLHLDAFEFLVHADVFDRAAQRLRP